MGQQYYRGKSNDVVNFSTLEKKLLHSGNTKDSHFRETPILRRKEKNLISEIPKEIYFPEKLKKDKEIPVQA
jgi:hypothetical protein